MLPTSALLRIVVFTCFVSEFAKSSPIFPAKNQSFEHWELVAQVCAYIQVYSVSFNP
jgi:hypothetical protein